MHEVCIKREDFISHTLHFRKGTFLPGRGAGGGKSASPEAKSAANLEFFYTPPSLIEPINYIMYTPL